MVITAFVLFSMGVAGATMTAVVARLFGVWMKNIQFGAGPLLVSFRYGSIPVELRALPMSCSVGFEGQDDHDEADVEDKVKLKNQPWYARVAIVFWISLLPILWGVLILGGDSLPVLISAVPDYLAGVFSPNEVGRKSIEDFIHYFQTEGWLRASAVAAIRVNALCLLPFILFQGIGQVLMTLINNRPSGIGEVILTLSSLFVLGFMVIWLYAIVRFTLLS